MRRVPAGAVWAALLTVYLLWGSTYLGIRYAIDSLPPFSMAAVRFVLAGGVLVAFLVLRRARALQEVHWLGALVVGFLLLTVGNGAVVWSEQTVPLGIVAVVTSTSAIWMVAADRVLFGTPVRWPHVAGTALGIAGIVLLANPRAALLPLLPAAVLVASSVSWGAGSVLSRRLPAPDDRLLGSGMQMLAGGLLLAVPAVLAGEPGHLHPERATAVSLLALAYLAVAGVVAFSLYMWLLRAAPVALVSTQSYVSPIVAVLLGVAVRGEALTTREALAGLVILGGVALIASAPVLTSRRAGGRLQAGRAA